MSKNANGAGSIRQITITRDGKPYKYWQGRYSAGYDPATGKQIQRSITGKTKKEVSQRIRELTHQIDEGTYTAPSKMTLKEWLTIWQRDYLSHVKPSTRYLYGKNIESYILPHLGAVKLEALSTPQIQHLYNELGAPTRKGVSGVSPIAPKTIKGVHGVLHKALQQAVQIGYIRTNPSDACTLPKIVRKEIKPLDDDQAIAFLNAIKGHPHELLYQIALFTGLREGEILGLTWDDVDLDEGKITVRKQLRREQKKGGQYYFSTPKNGKTRTLILAPSVKKLFLEQKLKVNCMRAEAGSAWIERDLVFCNAIGDYLSYRTVYDCFKRIVAKIGAPQTRFHDLRHTFAVMSLRNGDDIKTVQENLGHATAAFTLDVYGHSTDQMKRESSERMEERIKNLSSTGS